MEFLDILIKGLPSKSIFDDVFNILVEGKKETRNFFLCICSCVNNAVPVSQPCVIKEEEHAAFLVSSIIQSNQAFKIRFNIELFISSFRGLKQIHWKKKNSATVYTILLIFLSYSKILTYGCHLCFDSLFF